MTWILVRIRIGIDVSATARRGHNPQRPQSVEGRPAIKAVTAQRSRALAQLQTLTVWLLLLCWASASPAGTNTVLGQTASKGVIVDGSRVPSGTTLLSPSVIETRSSRARLFLAHGQILELERDSRAYLKATPSGGLEVAVDGGAAVVHGGEGEPVMVAASERLVFDRGRFTDRERGHRDRGRRNRDRGDSDTEDSDSGDSGSGDSDSGDSDTEDSDTDDEPPASPVDTDSDSD